MGDHDAARGDRRSEVGPRDDEAEHPRAREAAALLEAGAIEGLSIGYRTVKATKDDGGRRRLQELELWEVSLVTFPMLPEARVGAKGETLDDNLMRDLAAAIEGARRDLAQNRLKG